MPVRIVQLISGQTWTGGQQQVMHLTEGLIDRGNETVLVCQEGSMLETKARGRGLEVVTAPIRSTIDIALARLLGNLVRKRNIQLIDVHRAKPHGAAMMVRACTRSMVLVATRRVSFRIPSLLSARLKFSMLLDGIIAVSKGVRRSLLERRVPSEKIRVIYGAVDTDRFHPGVDPGPVRHEFSLVPDEPLIVVLANFTDWKGQKWFMPLLHGIIREVGPLKCIMAGWGTDGEEARICIRRHRLESLIIGTGFREDVESILAAADLFICPSLRGEGLTGAIREAMAMGVPVVSTGVGGNAELVVPGETGYLVPAGDGLAFQAACIRALCDRKTSLEMARTALDAVRNRFSIRSMVEETEEYYRELVDAKHRSQGIS